MNSAFLNINSLFQPLKSHEQLLDNSHQVGMQMKQPAVLGHTFILLQTDIYILTKYTHINTHTRVYIYNNAFQVVKSVILDSKQNHFLKNSCKKFHYFI